MIASTENYWHTLMRFTWRNCEKNLIKNQVESEMDRHLLDELKFLMVFIPFVSILMGLMWQKDGSNIVLHLFTVSL